jgi:hypothetical protein
VTAYNEAVGSFESRVIPQLRRIENAGATSGRAVELGGVEELPRAVTAQIEEPEPERAPLAELGPPADEIRAA